MKALRTISLVAMLVMLVTVASAAPLVHQVGIYWDDPSVPQGYIEVVSTVPAEEWFATFEVEVRDSNGAVVDVFTIANDCQAAERPGEGLACGPFDVEIDPADYDPGEYDVFYRLTWSAEGWDEVYYGIYIPNEGEQTYQDDRHFWYIRSFAAEYRAYLPLIMRSSQ